VVDSETGHERAPGETGLLEVRAPQLGSQADGGWLRTNDLAALDLDGFLWIRGRADDAIIRGGFKISAGHVAQILRRHPQIRDAAVVGVPDDRLGEVPIAVVEPALPAQPGIDVDALRVWSREYLAAYEVPADVLVVPALPRGAALKVDISSVRELVRARRSDPSPRRLGHEDRVTQ
jgi:acyl-CoA synthetase (AMP-forming)/AMP-acid ligase II